MTCNLRYGKAATLRLPIEPATSPGRGSDAENAAIDVRRATHEALLVPCEFPQLAEAVVSGDHVTVAVDRLVPRVTDVASAVVEYLMRECGVPSDSITVLFHEAAAAVPLVVRAPQTVPTAEQTASPVHVEVHDPDDRGKLSYLTNTPSGKPIYVSRAIGEADLVVAVGAIRGATSWSYRGPYGGVYPTFSDRATQIRFRNPALLHSADETFRKSQEEIESIGWKSGTQFTVQVVPGAGDEVAAVLAGEMSAVARRGAELLAERHRHEVGEVVQTAIAGLSGSAAQTWEQFALVLGTVVDAVEDGGVAALCTELAEPLGPAMELLSRCGDDRDAVLAHIRRERPVDGLIALQLAEAQRRVRIHLLSKLDSDVVENLGMLPIGDPDDLGRLASRSRSCLVVKDAQHAVLVHTAT